MRKRRGWRIVAIVVASLVVAIGGLLLVLRLTSPSVPASASVETKPIPTAWVNPPSEDASVSATQEDAAAPPHGRQPFAVRGSLAFVGSGRPFGSEAYDLDITDRGATLESTGQFSFKVVLATIRVSFSQSLEDDEALRPTTYHLDIDAPLGFGRKISGTIRDGQAVITQGKDLSEAQVDADRLFVSGMFSTYALIPVLFAEREVDGVARFDLLAFGGPSEQAGGADAPSTLTVTRDGDAVLVAGGLRLTVDRYRLETAYGESFLFAKGKDFLGFVAGDEEQSMIVYRSDYFPNGFEPTVAPSSTTD
jgi:hypothetical protein